MKQQQASVLFAQQQRVGCGVLVRLGLVVGAAPICDFQWFRSDPFGALAIVLFSFLERFWQVLGLLPLTLGMKAQPVCVYVCLSGCLRAGRTGTVCFLVLNVGPIGQQQAGGMLPGFLDPGVVPHVAAAAKSFKRLECWLGVTLGPAAAAAVVWGLLLLSFAGYRCRCGPRLRGYCTHSGIRFQGSQQSRASLCYLDAVLARGRGELCELVECDLGRDQQESDSTVEAALLRV